LVFQIPYRYFSRLLVIKVTPIKEKKSGDARILEAASSALPLVLRDMETLESGDVQKEVKVLSKHCQLDIRILEGIALAVVLARQVSVF
jgi:hypothetical protein